MPRPETVRVARMKHGDISLPVLAADGNYGARWLPTPMFVRAGQQREEDIGLHGSDRF